jgi:hypothetical protein
MRCSVPSPAMSMTCLCRSLGGHAGIRCDEDMTSSDMNHLATTFQDDDKVSSFICTIGNSKNRLLPNDINMTRNYGVDHKVYKDSHVGEKGQQRTFKPSWRPNTSQVRVQLRIQEQSILDWTPRPHTESDFDDPYMVGKIISYGFQWRRYYFKIPYESTGIVETSGP